MVINFSTIKIVTICSYRGTLLEYEAQRGIEKKRSDRKLLYPPERQYQI